MADQPATTEALDETEARPQLTGIFLPRAVLEDGRLSLLEKVLFGLLDGYARGEKGCFASNGYLARVLGRTPRAIRDAISALEAAGLVRRRNLVDFKNPDSKYGFTRRTIETVSAQAIRRAIAEGGRKKTSGGGGRKLPPYIKEIDKDPPSPPKGGRKARRIKLTAKDYQNGF